MRLIVLILALTFLAGAGPATAQQQNVANVPCVVVPPTATELIAKKHGEVPAFVGGANSAEGLFQIRLYFNPHEGNFTLFLVNPKGGHCVLMVGDGAEIAYVAPGEGS